MNKTKYIILKEHNTPIIFEDVLSHQQMARGKEVSSAGFVQIFADAEDKGTVGVTCFGESTSLKVKSDPENDEMSIIRMLDLICYGEKVRWF